jgi:hypothetical protein
MTPQILVSGENHRTPASVALRQPGVLAKQNQKRLNVTLDEIGL